MSDELKSSSETTQLSFEFGKPTDGIDFQDHLKLKATALTQEQWDYSRFSRLGGKRRGVRVQSVKCPESARDGFKRMSRKEGT